MFFHVRKSRGRQFWAKTQSLIYLLCHPLYVDCRFRSYFIIQRYFPDGSSGKESTCNAGDTGDLGSTPGSERCPGGGHDNPLQYSCLENPMGRGAWWVQSLGSQIVGHNRMTEHAHTSGSKVNNKPYHLRSSFSASGTGLHTVFT